MSTDITAGYALAQAFRKASVSDDTMYDIMDDDMGVAEPAQLFIAVGAPITFQGSFREGEGWEPASGVFALPLGSPTEKNIANTVIKTTWQAGRNDTTSTLKAALDSDLTTEGYTRPDGTAIT